MEICSLTCLDQTYPNSKSSTKCLNGDQCNVFAPSAFCKIPKMEKVTQKLKKERGARVVQQIFILSVCYLWSVIEEENVLQESWLQVSIKM